MQLDIAAQTDVGRRKKNNEDFYAIFREDTQNLRLFKEGAMLCVADGLGGHVGGEIASKLAVATFRDCLAKDPPDPSLAPEEGDKHFAGVLTDAMTSANANIHNTNKNLVKAGRPMGTTLLAALINPRKVYIANVGDSRCYHIRDGEIISATVDHSWVDEQVALGLMTKAEAEADSRKNILTRCIGTHPEVPVDNYLWYIVPGDIVLLCTDGLVNMVKDPDIRAVFQKRASAADYARELVDLANENGGRDNITVVIAQVSPGKMHSAAISANRYWRLHGKTTLWALATTLIAAAAFCAGWFLRGMR